MNKSITQNEKEKKRYLPHDIKTRIYVSHINPIVDIQNRIQTKK